MEEQNHDWLDKRLAASSYLPDDGFTTAVMERLPRTRVATAQRRTTILALAGTTAAALFVAHLPMAYETMSATVHHAITPTIPAVQNVWLNLNHDFLQPSVRYGAGGVLTLVTLAAIPFLRRWA